MSDSFLRFSNDILPCIKMDVGGGGEVFCDHVSTPLFLEKLRIMMVIKANTVQTTHIMTFFNSTSKKLEGEIVFPLPKDSEISGYGLDIDGIIVDAAPVEKEKARVAFDTTVREGGPAISVVEKVQAGSNCWKTKVYPMNPNGRRTVKVVVISPMITSKNDILTFLSLSKPAGIKELEFSFEAPNDETQVLVRRSNGMMEKVQPNDINATSDVEGILVVQPQTKDSEVFVEKDPDSGYHYFSATFSGIGGLLKGKPIEKISKISVFYDVSSSRKNSEWKQELKFLRDFLIKFEKNDSSAIIEVEVSTFSYCIHESTIFKDKNKLIEYLSKQRFDGGTCLPLQELSQPSNDCDYVLLFSDGITNFGKDTENILLETRFTKPIFCFSSAEKSSYLIMRYLGNQSGGSYFDLKETSIELVLSKITHEQITLKRVICDPIEALEEVYPSEIINDSITVYGKIIYPEKEPMIQLEFGPELFSEKIQISLSKYPQQQSILEPSTLLRTLWATQKIQRLSIFPSKNKKEIIEIGIEFGVVTDHTSLVVMTELSQYQKHKICPPKQLKELRKAYINEIQDVEEAEIIRRKKKIERVLVKWEERKEWHKRDFEKPSSISKTQKPAFTDTCFHSRIYRPNQDQSGRKKVEKINLLMQKNNDRLLLLRKKEESLENRIGQEMEKAKAYAKKKNKRLAKQCLLRKKKIEAQFNVLMNKKNNIENVNMKLEMQLTNLEVFQAQCSATSLMGDLSKEMGVHESMDDLRDTMADISEIANENLSQVLSSVSDRNEYDEPDLMDELDGIAMEVMDENLLAMDAVQGPQDPVGLKKGEMKSSEMEKKLVEKPILKLPTTSSESVIKVKAFQPDAEYLEIIHKSEDPYIEYLNQKEMGFEESPSFYLDCADYFLKSRNDVDIGIRILSNIVELELDNVQLFRIIGYRLDQSGKYDLAINTFEKVLKEKAEEPQSYRDLGLVLEQIGETERAAELLWEVICGNWDGIFDEIELTAAVELNHILYSLEEEEMIEVIKRLGINEKFVYKIDCDIRISMAWDTDMTDIDLHVYDPFKEHCYYSNKNTRSGGFLSRDFVKGYGPEEFMQKKVQGTGKFKVSAKYFSSHQQGITGGTTILCTFFTNYLRENEEKKLVTIRLSKNKEEIEVCEIDFKVGGQ